MPISLADFVVAIAIIFGVPIIAILLGRKRKSWGWGFVAGVIALCVIGNVVERLMA
jgi:hypothetical protein